MTDKNYYNKISAIIQKYHDGKINHKKASDEIQKVLPFGTHLEYLKGTSIKTIERNEKGGIKSIGMTDFPVKKVNAKKSTCPLCGAPYIKGHFYSTCTNKKCKNYDAFAFRKCGICGDYMYRCAC